MSEFLKTGMNRFGGGWSSSAFGEYGDDQAFAAVKRTVLKTVGGKIASTLLDGRVYQIKVLPDVDEGGRKVEVLVELLLVDPWEAEMGEAIVAPQTAAPFPGAREVFSGAQEREFEFQGGYFRRTR